ncbi:MAG: PEP-CTERM sorting domain-containing protein [Deltaproteobacteria bacterium]|nr:PEP-CTERM sorting domain-containing protein [Deltaproteobacteria bacterium]
MSFMYHARTEVENENGIKAFLGDDELGFVNGTLGTWGSGWTEVVWTFTVASVPDVDLSPYVLTFAAYGDDTSLGGFIDSVEIVSAPVPEPATIILLGTMGLVGFAGSRIRKKKK